MTYLIIYILLVFFAFVELSNTSKNVKKILYWFSFLVLMLLAGLRYETGGDWASYTDIFNSIEPIDDVLIGKSEYFSWSGMEFGYKLLNSICKFIIDNVQFLFFVIAIIISSVLFYSLPKYSPLPQLGILVYFGVLFFALDMIVIRQGIAVVIVFYSYRYIKEQKFRKVLFICLLASLFHVSALIMIPLYFFIKREFSSKVLVIMFVLFNVVLFLHIRWLSPILEIGLSFLLDPHFASKLTNYLTNDIYAVGRGITFGFLINSVTFIVLILNREKLSKYPYFNLFLNLFILYLFVYCCMSELVEVGNRLKYYFMISFIVLLPMLVDTFRILTNRLILYLGVCGFSFMYARPQIQELPIASAFNPYQNYIIYYMTNKPSTGLERLNKSDQEFSKERGQ